MAARSMAHATDLKAAASAMNRLYSFAVFPIFAATTAAMRAFGCSAGSSRAGPLISSTAGLRLRAWGAQEDDARIMLLGAQRSAT